MKIIKLSTDNEISVHQYPVGDTYDVENKAIRTLIGDTCRLYEHVMPRRLYTELGGINEVGKQPGRCVSMLIDEEGRLKDLPINLVGSWLYQMDQHGNPIVGNILIVGEMWEDDGISFCGICEEQFGLLYPKLKKITEKARKYV